MRKRLRAAWVVLAGLALVVLALVAAGQAGALQGTPPAHLGVVDGRLQPPSTRPNSVSSQAHLWPGHPQQVGAQVAALPVALPAALPAASSAAATMQRLQTVVAAMPGARVVTARPDYLYVQFQTRWLRFVDDAEFWWDPAAGVVHVRSASRLGHSDLGANRARVEALRAALLKP